MNEMLMNGINDHRLCNEALDTFLDSRDKALMISAATEKVAELLDVLRIAHRDDQNTRDTPARVAKMLVEELLAGRYSPEPSVTEFRNVGRCDQMILTGPIEVRSTCAHHLLPIFGEAVIGVLPRLNGNIVGLSKYDRIVHHFSARLQIQEELVRQIGDYIMEQTQPRGLAVWISAVHMCKTHRGVRAPMSSRMTSTAYYGEFLESSELKNEFLQQRSALKL